MSSAGASDNITSRPSRRIGERGLEVGYSSVITNADTGVLLTWGAWNTYSWEPRQPPVPPNTQTFGIAVTAGTGVSVLDAPLAGQAEPVLQAQDGSFVGSYGFDMISFDQSGNVRWMVPNYSPLMATADGEVIATSDYMLATVFDEDGNATGRIPNMPIYSWKGAYQTGSVDSVLPVLDLASTIATSSSAVPGGNRQRMASRFATHTFGSAFCRPEGDGTWYRILRARRDARRFLVSSCTPAQRTDLHAQAVDFSGYFGPGYPQWVATIKNEAAEAYAHAFDFSQPSCRQGLSGGRLGVRWPVVHSSTPTT